MTTNRGGEHKESKLQSARSWCTRPSTLDGATDWLIALGVALLLAVGFAASYTTLLTLAATAGGYPVWLAPVVPLSFDVGVIVLSLKVVRAAREGRTAPVLRLLVVALSVATVAANASAANTPAGAVLHAVPPAMFVVCFESVIASTRRHALERFGLVPPKLPRVRGVRWVLDPWPTFKDWRDAVIERDLFEQESAPAPAPKRTPQATPQQDQAPSGAPQPLRIVAARKRPAALASGRGKRVGWDELLSAAHEINAASAAPLTQRSLQAALKAAPYGYGCGATRALELIDALAAKTRQEA